MEKFLPGVISFRVFPCASVAMFSIIINLKKHQAHDTDFESGLRVRLLLRTLPWPGTAFFREPRLPLTYYPSRCLVRLLLYIGSDP